MPLPKVLVTNFNKNFTGVSATAAAVIAVQKDVLDIHLVGEPLPNCPVPISRKKATLISSKVDKYTDFTIWHVRRNEEMRTAIWVRDVLKKPIKIVFTSAAQRRHSAYPRWLISKMDLLIATSKEAASFINNVHSVVPHGVSTDNFFPVLDRAQAWKNLEYGGSFGVACVGRIRPEKGTDLFVQSMLKILPKKPNMVALIIGKVENKHKRFKEKLVNKISNANLSDRIIFTGEIKANSMPKVMSAISLLITLPRYEGYGMTPLESLASGTPFVGTKTGYFEEFSSHGKYGSVVGLGDVDGASDAIIDWLSKNDKLDDFSKNAQQYILNNYSIEKEVNGIIEAYKSLLDNKE